MKTPDINPLARDLDDVYDAVGTAWDDLSGARIFLTGGTGFFGRWLLESFAWANRRRNLGARAVVLSRDPAAFAAQSPHLASDPAITFHTGDVRRFEGAPGRFTHIIHAATESVGRGHDRLHMVDTIVGGTRNVLDFAVTCGAARLLYVSSGAVYGRSRPEPVPVSEDDRTAPLIGDADIDYDESKRMAEALCALYAREKGLHASIARCFTFVGPHLPLDRHYAVGNFIRDALAGAPIRVSGDGTAVRSYLYMGDLAAWLWTILLRGEAGRPYNVGSDETVTIAELARRVAEAVNPAAAVEIAREPVPGVPVNFMAPEIGRARRELDLHVTVPLDEAIRRTAAWNREHTALPGDSGNREHTVLPGDASDFSVAHAEVARDTDPAVNAAAGALSALLPVRGDSRAPIDVLVFDFDGVMTDNRVAVLEDGREAVFCNRSDGLGIGRLRALGVPMLVLSTEVNPVVAARCAKLKLECLQGIEVKEDALAQWLAARGYDPARTIYVGNDINDLGCLRLAGYPVAVGDAYDEVKAIARLVLKRPGGHGAVRELADMICGLFSGKETR